MTKRSLGSAMATGCFGDRLRRFPAGWRSLEHRFRLLSMLLTLAFAGVEVPVLAARFSSRACSVAWLILGCTFTCPSIQASLRMTRFVLMRPVNRMLSNERTSGNAAVALWFHVQRLSRAVPECER